MHVDCATCPARPVACDGCMMTVLFGGPNWDDAPVEGGASVTVQALDDDAELDLAIDVFQSAAMVTSAAARSARTEKTARQKPFRVISSTELRAG
ncbi:hypothetical protein BJF87_11190 [Gordonia sp. CNJ-863]|uniref:Uncharacterized protein n=2 Tax=Gordoniaceae TaxID=85026 RepID=W9DFH9_9ACTN|nr:hypothetical protein V525_19690 [Gordonia alkanivorans CGMCC 6845]OLT40789.1 hypothetical protein BJF87_11190 [Gordonia sp. CNJ-863]